MSSLAQPRALARSLGDVGHFREGDAQEELVEEAHMQGEVRPRHVHLR